MADTIEDELLRPHEVAALLKVEEDTLYRWRLRGCGPKYSKIGRGKGSIRYSKRIIFQFVSERERQSTSQQVEAA